MKWKISQLDIEQTCKEVPEASIEPSEININETDPFKYRDEPSIKKDNHTGLFSSEIVYNGILENVCKYAAYKQIESEENDAIYNLSYDSYEKSPNITHVQTDVDKEEPVYSSFKIIYEDKIITGITDYFGFKLTCFSKSKNKSLNYINKIKKRMSKENQYRGKCLFFDGETVSFRNEPEVNWEDVVMSKDNKKEILRNTVNFFSNNDLRNYGLNKRGLILYGPPGTGKTMVVKSIFSQLKDENITRIYSTAESFRFPSDVSVLFDFLKYTGESVLAFEDMDLISPERGEGSGREVLGSLLNNLDGIRQIKDPLVVIGTTNDVSLLDYALANRPSRFDRKIEVPLPQGKQIIRFYEKLLNEKISPNIKEDIISKSKGFSGAHIKETVNTAYIMSIEDKSYPSDCLLSACDIINNNFYPMEKEATQSLYKNNKTKFKKEGQTIYFMPNEQGFSQDFNMDFLNYIINFKNNGSISNKVATSLWKLWKNQENIKNNTLNITGFNNNEIMSLKSGGIINEENDKEASLTDEGIRLIRTLILTQEVSPLDKKEENNTIDMAEVNQSLYAKNNNGIKKSSKNKSSKNKSSKNKSSKNKSSKNKYFDCVKDIFYENRDS